MNSRGAFHLVVNVRAFEGVGAFDAESPRLKRTEPAGNDDRARVEARVVRGAQQERVVLEHLQLGDFLAEMKLRVERLRLLQQSIDQFLRAADRQRRNVVDGLFGIQLAALTAGMLQRIDDVRVNAEQTQLEDLKQAAGTGADDDDVGLNGAVDGDARSFSLKKLSYDEPD